MPDNGHPDRYITGPIIIIPALSLSLSVSLHLLPSLLPLVCLPSSSFFFSPSLYPRNFPPLGRLLFSPTVWSARPPVYRDESGPGSDGTSVTNDPDSRLSSSSLRLALTPVESGPARLSVSPSHNFSFIVSSKVKNTRRILGVT